MLTERRKKIQISLSGEVRAQQQHEQRPVIAEFLAQQAHGLPDTVIDRLRGNVEAGGYFFVGRANYVLKDRYIFTASYRRDGSSRFAPGNKFANFASGAVAWVLSEEDFIKNLNIFSNLKLRASYGQTGNQGINSYQTMVSLGSANYPFGGITDSGFAGDTSKGPLNKDLKWETTDQYKIGRAHV